VVILTCDRSYRSNRIRTDKSVDEYSSKVQQLGGKVHVSKTAVPGMGYFAFCLDTDNNAFDIW
jgi:predicted enzyme related to lactoylglutathione lyase